MEDKKKRYHLKKMLFRLKRGQISVEDCGLPELTKEEAIKLVREEIRELEGY